MVQQSARGLTELLAGQLFITVPVYQAVQVLCRKLKLHGVNAGWTSLREIFSGQQRVTATFTRKDGRTLHVRKITLAGSKQQSRYDALSLSASPVGTRILVS